MLKGPTIKAKDLLGASTIPTRGPTRSMPWSAGCGCCSRTPITQRTSASWS